jgi:hypothetical protein
MTAFAGGGWRKTSAIPVLVESGVEGDDGEGVGAGAASIVEDVVAGWVEWAGLAWWVLVVVMVFFSSWVVWFSVVERRT